MRKLYDTEVPDKKGFLVSFWNNQIDKTEAQSLERELLGLASTLDLLSQGRNLFMCVKNNPDSGWGAVRRRSW